MTVSPRLPQDGTPAPEGVSDHNAANASTNPPPTLLRLPNLNVTSTAPPAQEMAAHHQPTHAPLPQNPLTPNNVSPNANSQGFSGGQPQPVQPTVAPQTFSGQPAQTAVWASPGPQSMAQPASVPSHPTAIQSSGMPETGRQVDRQIERQQATDQSFAGRTFPNLSDQDSDAPAGRSWMEIAQQHGVVVLLLLVVVAAAVFTGRGSDVDDPEVAIVDAVDLFGVEDGIAVDTPMPNHRHDSSTVVASSPQAALLSESSDIAFTEQPIASPAGNTNHRTSVASLEPPHTATDSHSVAASGQHQSPVVENQFAQQLNAMPVANRFNTSTALNSDITFNAPSLEELADSLPEEATTVESEPPTIPAFGKSFDSRMPVRSKTPVGISDWTQYLPQLPSATSK